MEPHSDGADELTAIKELRQQHETRIQTLRNAQLELIASLQTKIPNIASSLDLSLQTISTITGKPFTPLPTPLPTAPNHNPNLLVAPRVNKRVSELCTTSAGEKEKVVIDECGGPLSVVRAMVAVCLLERVPFTAIDSSTLLRKLENDRLEDAEKVAMRELGGDSGAIMAIEMALKSMAEDNACVELENFVVSGKSRTMVLNIDRTRLLKELPESKQSEGFSGGSRGSQEMVKRGSDSGGVFGMGRAMSEMWEHPHMQGMTAMFPGNMGGPRGGHRGMVGMMGMPRGVGVPPPMPRPPMGLSGPVGGGNSIALKPRTEEDEMKDLENMLNKKSFKEMQKSKTGEELLDLIHRPTAKESAVAARFKSKGGSQVKEYCSALTKEDCRRQSGSYIACDKVHFRRIIAAHTDVNLGDCSFLDTCRHMKTCKYVHYELDSTPDVSPLMMGAATLPPPRPLKPQRAHYCSEVELGEPQWINCDIRSFRMDILGQFGVIMADPPWDIHMELPYGTMADDEMRTLNVPALQTDGLIFLWVTGRAMELGRECLELWGYKRVEEIIWVKTNQLQRIIRTGRTGHWLNHSKEHCLVGIKGNPEVNRNIDTDVIVAEVRETSRKPDEMYPLLERISPRTRKLELFARMHNVHAGWMSLGNQLQGVRLVDEGLRARFKAAYPDVEVQPASPPRVSAMEVDSSSNQMRSTFSGGELKAAGTQVAEITAPDAAYATEAKAVNRDV
ncbi:N6-adenosine-methyltransferase MT-A70-like [Capsicum annuum]|uniref:N6-adenosine-methyltransferase MT-A70-like n=1 Tax=Capsicum annuum TaxID=4072 RepID=A0A1U8DUK0_CAPAN|nr:N6-adenosine-methyltransferase MT-A70-like isoform X1 [Capsicum annuum]KAF3670326.1 N6-adenosine-methyltransferase MT-A70-like [Capsicum annuum]PHT74291.1 N6-adenosine-methyltransferase MT-A70-like [Capsicum annuum]